MTEAEVRVPTSTDLLHDVREGVEEIVRAALTEAANLHEEADVRARLAPYASLFERLEAQDPAKGAARARSLVGRRR